jgi:ubiquinone/menaquinone biosynthesis C-methylase UbiE
MSASAVALPADLVALLRCPASGGALRPDGDALVSADGAHRYAVAANGIPLFAEALCSEDARRQQAHYDTIANAYVANLAYPHTEEYMAYLDRALLGVLDEGTVGIIAEICCGHGEAFGLLGERIGRGVGIDVTLSMLDEAVRRHPGRRFSFVQGDATTLPLVDDAVDAVFMLGGIHHVNDRRRLFDEIHRVLKPGGRFYFREPLSDLFLWRWLRAVVYRLSPLLDHARERPLLRRETVPVLSAAGLVCRDWRTYGFLGFCLFMNSDVLVFNRLFRFLPGIRALTRFATRLDDWTLRLPGLADAGLQVVGVAEKPLRTR